MKKNDALFREPTRQSIVAILLIIYKYINVIIRQIWPFLLIFLVGGGSDRKMSFAIGLAAIASVSMIWAIISYFKFYFYVDEKELVIESGVLKKTNLNIPFDRIQSVNLKQNILHQVLNVVELEVDTAGTAKSEFKFDALSKEKADALRSILIQKRDAIVSDEPKVIGEHHVEEALEGKSILRLSIPDLIKIGVSQNHFRSVGLILFVLIWLQQSIDDAGYNTDQYMDTFFDLLLSAGLLAMIMIIMVSVLIAVIISLFRTVLVYFNADLQRIGDRLKLTYGLFNKKEQSALYEKIQILQWGNNPLQKWLSIFEVRLKQASSSVVAAKRSIRIPGCSLEQIDYLKETWLGQEALENLETTGISIHYFYRRVMYRMIFCAILFTAYFARGEIDGLLVILILLVPYFICTSWLSYKKTGFAINDKTLFISKGIFDDEYAILPLSKIQNLKLNQSPYQTRKELANLKIYTASGSISIPYLPLGLGEELSDYFLYQVERKNEKWM